MSENKKKIAPVNEIVAALLAERYSNDVEFAKMMEKDAKQAMAKMSSEQMPSDMEVHIVQNTADKVHVPLPIYSVLEQEETMKTLSDVEMSAVAGGEVIFLSIATALGITVSTAAGLVGAAVSATIVGTTAAVVGTAVGTGIAASKGAI